MSVNFVAAIGAIPLLKFHGRRSLLILTFFVCTVCLVALAVFAHNETIQLIAVIVFIVMFEFGPGPIGWIYMSEVMNQNGVAVGTFINWLFTLIMGVVTPSLFNSLDTKAFYIFAGTCGLGCVFCYVFVKETKGLNEAELMNLYRP